MSNCPVCKFSDVATGRSAITKGIQFDCRRCGRFEPSFPLTSFASLSTKDKAKLSGWIKDQNDLGETPVLTWALAQSVLEAPDKSVPERIQRLLAWAVKQQRLLGGSFGPIKPDVFSSTYSEGSPEIMQLYEYLLDLGLIQKTTTTALTPKTATAASTSTVVWRVTPKGFIENEKNVAQVSSTSGFIAMWFNEVMADARNFGIMPAIQKAGYKAVIVDRVEHVNKIDDEIVAQIRKAKFVVADFTGHRGGVYFEAGFAMGLNLPVFWTCRKDHLTNLHFDVRQYNCIDWTEPTELATRLQNRIEAVLSRGPHPSGSGGG